MTHTQQRENGKMIVICSAVGGTGRTTLTVNLAALLVKQKIKTVVFDGDLQFGDLALALDLKPVRTIKELVERNDVDNVQNYYTKHETGINLLAAPNRPEYADLVTTDLLDSITDSILADTEVLLVETQHGLNEQNLLLMEKADEILITATSGMAVLKNTTLIIETLEMLGLKGKAKLIVNKSTTSSVIKSNDIPKLTQVDQAYFLPEDSKHVPHSLDVGIPLVMSNPKHAYSKAVNHVAEKLFTFEPIPSKKMAMGAIMSKIAKKIKGLRIRREKDEFTSQIAIEESAGSNSN